MASTIYTTLLFDFDHTLFDSHASETAALTVTLDAYGVSDPAAHFEAYRQINRSLWHEVEQGRLRPDDVGLLRFEQLTRAAAIDADPVAMAGTYLHAMGNNGDLYPGARAVLDQLAGRVTLAMVTNAISSVQRSRIERLDLASYFDAIVISSEVGVAKPNPAIFDITFDRLVGSRPSHTLMIGDSLTSDMRGGANAGIDTCWYNPSGHAAGPDDSITHRIADLADLLGLVDDDDTGTL